MNSFSQFSTLDFIGIMVQWSGKTAVKGGSGGTERDQKNRMKEGGPVEQENPVSWLPLFYKLSLSHTQRRILWQKYTVGWGR